MEKVLLYVVHDDTHEAFEDPTKSLLCYLFTYYIVGSFKQFLLWTLNTMNIEHPNIEHPNIELYHRFQILWTLNTLNIEHLNIEHLNIELYHRFKIIVILKV